MVNLVDRLHFDVVSNFSSHPPEVISNHTHVAAIQKGGNGPFRKLKKKKKKILILCQIDRLI